MTLKFEEMMYEKMIKMMMKMLDAEDNDANNEIKILNAEKKYSGCDLNTYPRFRTDVLSS